MDTDGQRQAIRAGLDVWQRLNPRIGFLELSAEASLIVSFVAPTELPHPTTPVGIGLLPGTVPVLAGLRSEAGGRHMLLLSNGHDWTRSELTRTVAYHAGLLLGMATSSDPMSLMSLVASGGVVRASKADSLAINAYYTTPCKDLTAVDLPFTLTVGGPVSKTIRFSKDGVVSISASGQMKVGELVGNSGPEGREFGVLGFSLADYSIDRTLNHAALIYKLNTDTQWRLCGRACSFTSNGQSYADLILGVNDRDLTDNAGGYNVVVSYRE
ncbi:hypothetical protein GCM10027578_16970 [Spirosoma luteolum]